MKEHIVKLIWEQRFDDAYVIFINKSDKQKDEILFSIEDGFFSCKRDATISAVNRK